MIFLLIYVILGTMVHIEFEPDPQLDGRHPYIETFVLITLYILWPLALLLSKDNE